MPYKTTLIAGKSEERRYFLFRKTIEKLKKEDTVIIPIGYWERFDSLSYQDGRDICLDFHAYFIYNISMKVGDSYEANFRFH